MPSRVRMLQLALDEIQQEHELLTRKHERLIKQHATLRVRLKVLEARIADLEAGPPPGPKKGRRP